MASTTLAHEDKYAGARVATLENDQLRVKVVPEKGSDVVEVVYKERGINLLWENPGGFRRFGSISPTSETQTSGFLDFYEGGWQDVLPNPGQPSSYKESSWGLHGESCLLPWSAAVADESDTAMLRLTTHLVRYPLRIEKTLSLGEGSGVLKVDETVTNLGEQDLELAWVQHIVFGRPLIGPDAVVDLRAGRCEAAFWKQSRLKEGIPFAWPHAPSREGPALDMSRPVSSPGTRYVGDIFVTLKEPWYAVRSPGLGITVGLSWDMEVLPFLWYWLNNGALDYPFWGRGYSLGLEPSSVYGGGGIGDYTGRGSSLKIGEGRSLRLGIRLSVKEGAGAVLGLDGDGHFL